MRTSQRWKSRPLGSWLLRVAAFLMPALVAAAGALAVGRTLRLPPTPTGTALWWTAVIGTAASLLWAAERAARRLLPLAALLELTIAFPDRAPSRLAVARRAGGQGKLRERARQLEGEGDAGRAAALALALATALTAHDPRTRGHAERVRAYSDLLAEELRLGRRQRDRLRWAAVLHDIGKLTVPPEVLNKPSEPDEQEWEILRRHPLDGERLLGPLREWLGPWSAAISQHHERYDGTGYPLGLAGDEIYLGARIVAVADAFDALTAVRTYRTPVSFSAAREELAGSAGTHFDPRVVRAFLNISIGRLWRAFGPVAWLATLPLLRGVRHLPRQVAVAGTTTATLAYLAVAGPLPVPLIPQAPVPESAVAAPPAPAGEPGQAGVPGPAGEAPFPATATPQPAPVPAAGGGEGAPGGETPIALPAAPPAPGQVPPLPPEGAPGPAPPPGGGGGEQPREDGGAAPPPDDEDGQTQPPGRPPADQGPPPPPGEGGPPTDEGETTPPPGDDGEPGPGPGSPPPGVTPPPDDGGSVEEPPPEEEDDGRESRGRRPPWAPPRGRPDPLPPGNDPPDDPVPPVPPGHDEDFTPPGKRGG